MHTPINHLKQSPRGLPQPDHAASHQHRPWCDSELKNILHRKDIPITFISNPKVACSTIKNSLLDGFDGNVHQEAERRFDLPIDANHTYFCITRNPYSRALSCFKNKIGKGKELFPTVWPPFCKRFGFDPNSNPSFLDYLTALCNDPHPETFDLHYRAQVFNLHHSDITPSYIGRIEDFKHLTDYLNQFKIILLSRNSHKTNALQTYREEVSSEEAALIEKIYALDFDTYKYPKDLKSTTIPSPIQQKQKVSSKYLTLFQMNALNIDVEDLIKIGKKALKKGNIEKAKSIYNRLNSIGINSKSLKRALAKIETAL